MARRRMIDPNIWQSEDFARLSVLAKLVFIGMFSQADDEGRGRSKPVYIKSVLFPYDDGMRITDIEKALSEIGQNLSVTFYVYDGNEYYSLDNWKAWQKVDKPTASKIPGSTDSDIVRRTFGEDSANRPGALGEESRLKEKNQKRREKKDSAEPASGSPPAILLTLNDGTDYPVSQEQCQEWAGLYPAVDVIQQLREMRGWLLSNPTKRKTRRGIQAFVTRWLGKEQDKGGTSTQKQTNAFEAKREGDSQGDYWTK